jgi:hypothetical protein
MHTMTDPTMVHVSFSALNVVVSPARQNKPHHINMTNIPTIEELDKTGCEAAGYAAGYTSVTANYTTHCRYLTAIRDAVVAACLPQLRPIAEMPEEVPEGCVRRFWRKGNLDWYSSTHRLHTATHFIDIAVPADTYPTEFDTAWETAGKPEPKSAAYALWKGGEHEDL